MHRNGFDAHRIRDNSMVGGIIWIVKAKLTMMKKASFCKSLYIRLLVPVPDSLTQDCIVADAVANIV